MKNEIKTMKIFTALFPLVLVAMTVQGTEKQVQDLEKDIAALKAELEQLSGDGGTVTQMSENIKTAEAEVESTREALASKEKSIAGNEFLLGVYQSAFRVVTTLTPGTDLGIVQFSDGELLQGASFISADRGGILVQLPTGSRTVNVALLPDSFSDRVQLPPRTAPITMTVAALKQSKPDFLLTKEELAAAKSGNSNTAVASTGKNVGQEQGAVAPVAKKGSETEAANTFEEVRKRNDIVNCCSQKRRLGWRKQIRRRCFAMLRSKSPRRRFNRLLDYTIRNFRGSKKRKLDCEARWRASKLNSSDFSPLIPLFNLINQATRDHRFGRTQNQRRVGIATRWGCGTRRQ